MEMAGLADVPDIPVPDGYVLRNFRNGDEAGLARVYCDSRLDKDTVEIVRRDILGDPCFKPERVFVLEFDGQLVGTASAWLAEDESDAGYLHMVGVLSEHRGKRLGALLTCAALRYTRSEGFDTQRLLTDDWRTDAIHLYLKLGYYPLLADDSHPARWEAIGQKLNYPGILARSRRMKLRTGESLFVRLRRLVGFGNLIQL